jgi:serine/threonine protein kinase
MSMIGKTLAHYEITSQLGKGGMGEVYQAKDRKLGRDVAIKVLPQEFARDTDRVARFQREAKLLASLNHPNVAAIYGLEESGGTNFLVLELVEGETLADRIKAGPVTVEESLKLALQIAEALEAAHEKGVIHRDLKPANIKVTPDGKVKVLDFGLAKAYAGEKEKVDPSNSPTLSDAATQQGVILGTAAYMSPEQARGKAVDKKADIWAFGAVLFEMLAGRAAFSGKDVTDILAAVIRSEPEWNSLPANLHWRLQEVLERCLKKDAKDRYHDISDVKVDVQRILTDPSGLMAQPAIAAPRTRLRTMLPWLAAILGIIIVGIAIWLLKQPPPPEPRQVMRFEYDLPEGQQLTGLDLSPDGKQFVYSTTKGIYVRSVNELIAKLIAGTEGPASQPFYSPDGKSIGYFTPNDNWLKKIAITGGAPINLCTALAQGAWWGADNTIVYSTITGGIFRISANGGTPESLIKAKSEILFAPQILPDGKSVLYSAAASNTQMRVMVQSPKLREPKELFAGAGARYLPSGHIVYRMPNSNNLFAVAFDLDKLKVIGSPVSILEGFLGGAVSESGNMIYVSQPAAVAQGAAGTASSGPTLVWVNREGKEEPLGAPPHNYFNPKISPDGTKVALAIFVDANMDIYIWDLARETLTRLTFEKGTDILPIWTPDGKRIVFASDREGNRGIYWKAADGTGEDEKLSSTPDKNLMPWCWSSDGKTLVMMEMDSAYTKSDIGTLSMEGDRARKLLLKEKFLEANPNISPDGKYIAFLSAESGRGEVYVRPFPEVSKGKWQISDGGADFARWSPDGRELLYNSSDAIMAVSVETEPTFKPGKTKVLFKGAFIRGYGATPSWDISPDGKRLLIIKPPIRTGAAPTAAVLRKIVVVINGIEELKQRVPVK